MKNIKKRQDGLLVAKDRKEKYTPQLKGMNDADVKLRMKRLKLSFNSEASKSPQASMSKTVEFCMRY